MTMRLDQVVGEPGFAARWNCHIAEIAASVHATEVTSVVGDMARLLHCNGAVFAAFDRGDIAAVRQINDPRIRRIAVLMLQSSSTAQPRYRAALHALDPLFAAEVDNTRDLADA